MTNFEGIKRKIATMNADELIEFCGGLKCRCFAPVGSSPIYGTS